MPDIQTAILFALTIMNAAANVALWLRKPGEDAGQAVQTLRTEVREALGRQGATLGVLEERVRHLPDGDELAAMKAELAGIRERLGGMGDVVTNTRAAVQRIEDFLRQHSK